MLIAKKTTTTTTEIMKREWKALYRNLLEVIHKA